VESGGCKAAGRREKGEGRRKKREESCEHCSVEGQGEEGGRRRKGGKRKEETEVSREGRVSSGEKEQ